MRFLLPFQERRFDLRIKHFFFSMMACRKVVQNLVEEQARLMGKLYSVILNEENKMMVWI